ncbi:hypothetical protein ES705_29375 [subsurface metagenome]
MVKCKVCNKEFKNAAGLAGHMKGKHPDASPIDGPKLLDLITSQLLQTAQRRGELARQTDNSFKLVLDILNKEAALRQGVMSVISQGDEKTHQNLLKVHQLIEGLQDWMDRVNTNLEAMAVKGNEAEDLLRTLAELIKSEYQKEKTGAKTRV